MLNYWLPKNIIGTIKNKKMARPKNAITGIYKITSPSGKIYIGQSVNINKRKQAYKHLNSLVGQPKIYYSMNKYGIENHMFEIIEKCSIEQLDEREYFWKIYYLEQANNDWHKVLFCELHDSGGGPKSEETKNKLRGQKRSEEVKFKMSEIAKANMTPEHRKKLSDAQIGIPKSEEHKKAMKVPRRSKGSSRPDIKGKARDEITRKKIGKGNQGTSKPGITEKRKGITLSQEHKDKISKSNSGVPRNNIKVDQYTLDGCFIKTWPSLLLAANSINIHPICICEAIKMRRQKTSGGYIWKKHID